MSVYDSIALIVNTILVLIIIINIIWFIQRERIKKIEKRLFKYSIESVNDTRESLFDLIIDIYIKMRNRINSFLYKIDSFKKYSLKYEKYTSKENKNRQDPMNYVSTKFICAFIILFLVLVNNFLQYNPISFYQLITGFLLGFFIPDIFLFGKNKIIKKQMENDLLKAITIMNNSFKSGRSIIQTIKIVGEEIDGPLKNEFIKMYRDLSYGLDIETVFERFNSRVKLNEVQYITTSLSILNKTGGNIVKVFSSIERTVFNNRKLNEELKNLSASSKMLYRVLTMMPIVFSLVIYLIDNTYFMPLFKTSLGIIIVIIISIIYIAYIIIVKKIIRIREY